MTEATKMKLTPWHSSAPHWQQVEEGAGIIETIEEAAIPSDDRTSDDSLRGRLVNLSLPLLYSINAAAAAQMLGHLSQNEGEARAMWEMLKAETSPVFEDVPIVVVPHEVSVQPDEAGRLWGYLSRRLCAHGATVEMRDLGPHEPRWELATGIYLLPICQFHRENNSAWLLQELTEAVTKTIEWMDQDAAETHTDECHKLRRLVDLGNEVQQLRNTLEESQAQNKREHAEAVQWKAIAEARGVLLHEALSATPGTVQP